MATFLDYYREELAKRGATAPRKSSMPKASKGKEAADEPTPLSPVNWILDIINRPTYGSVNANRSNVDRITTGAQKLQQGDLFGGVSDVVAGIPTMPTFLSPASTVTNLYKKALGNDTDQKFAEGVVNPANNPDLKRSNEWLLEYTSDQAGSKLDPKYVDTPDNVAPAVKGTAGFVLDVAGDPLTYVSGTGLLAGAKGIASAADKGLSAVSRGLVGAKAGERVAESVKSSSKAPKNKKTTFGGEENPFEDAAKANPDAFRPTQANVPATTGKVERLETFGTDLAKAAGIIGAPTPRAPKALDAPPQLALESGAKGAAPAANVSMLPVDEAVPVVRQGDEAQASVPPEPTVQAVASGSVAPTPGGSIADIINASPNRQGISDTLTGLADDISAPRAAPTYNEWANALPPTHMITDPTGVTRAIPVAKLRDDIKRFQDPSIKPNLKPTKQYIEKTLNLLRQEYQKTVAPQSSVVDALTAFQARAAADERSIKNALGDDLYNYLARTNSPAKFQKDLVDIRKVIEPDEAIADTLRSMDQNLARVLSDRLGVPRSARAKTPEEAAAHAAKLLSENEPYQAALANGLAKALDAELVDLSEKGYSYYFRHMGMKVARTDKETGEGLGRYVDQLNGFSQYTMLRNQSEAIEIAALDIMRARGIKGASFTNLYSAQRTGVYKEAVLRVLDDQAKLLDDIGAHMSIGTGADTVQLSMNEVYRELLASADELGIARTIDQGLFNYGTQAAPTAVTDAMAAAIAGASREDIVRIITDPKKYGNKGLLPNNTGKRPNNLIDSGHGWGFAQNAKKAAQRLADEAGGVVKPNPSGKGGWYVSYKVDGQNRMAEALADTIMKAKDNLGLRAAQNEMAFVARTRQEVHKLSSDELAKIESFLKDPSGTIAKIRAFKARGTRIEADAAKINASADAVDASKSVVDLSLGEELVSTMTAAGKAEPKYASASTELDLQRANESLSDDVWEGVVDDYTSRPSRIETENPLTGLREGEEWAEVVDEATPLRGDWRDMVYDEAEEYLNRGGKSKKPKKGRGGKGSVDLSEDVTAMVDSFGNRIVDPYGILKYKIGQWFNQNFKAESAMPIAHAWQNSMSLRTSYMKHQLNAIAKTAKKISPDQDLLPNVFSAIQRGVAPTDPKMAELDGMIREVLKDFFDLDVPGSMGNVFLRTTTDARAVNAMFKQKGLDFELDFGLAKETAAKKNITVEQALSRQWQDWTIDDPLEFMHKMTLAREELAFNKGTAMSFMEMSKRYDAVSKVKTPGYVKIQASGESRFASHLPKNVYVKRELAEELQRVEQVFRTSREFQGQLGDFVRNVYAPLLNSWKFAITLPRPGHHIRNLIGDTSVTWMRRGSRDFARSWKDAVKVLSTRGNYRDVNMREAATRYGTKDLPVGGDKIFSTGDFEFTADELYAALAEGGALPSYNVGEDFLDATGTLNKVLGKATLRDTPVGTGLGWVSEGRDHLARFQHFIQALRQDGRGWKGSKEDLIDSAVKEVIKYHPDSSLLTTMESKLRLAIPFYSWFGKIIPALVESMIMHPGRLSTFNKASYNWAVANGLDPESLSDPFPDDQLFPSFLTDAALGPQFTANLLPGAEGQYVRMNPGIAHLDVMDTLGADPLRGIAGMTSPLVRVPVELFLGASAGTGARISDKSDYLDQSIPGINYLANITGVSPTGSVGSLLSGQGLDPQRQVEKGGKTDFDKALSAANWVTGLGLQNLSRPSYVDYAEIERRNAESGK